MVFQYFSLQGFVNPKTCSICQVCITIIQVRIDVQNCDLLIKLVIELSQLGNSFVTWSKVIKSWQVEQDLGFTNP